MWQEVEEMQMISYNTVRTTDSLIDEPEFLDAVLISIVSSMQRWMNYNYAKYVTDWDDLEREAIRQAHALVEERGNAIFGKHTSWWDRLRGRQHYTRIDIEFDRGNIEVHITPVA